MRLATSQPHPSSTPLYPPPPKAFPSSPHPPFRPYLPPPKPSPPNLPNPTILPSRHPNLNLPSPSPKAQPPQPLQSHPNPNTQPTLLRAISSSTSSLMRSVEATDIRGTTSRPKAAESTKSPQLSACGASSNPPRGEIAMHLTEGCSLLSMYDNRTPVLPPRECPVTRREYPRYRGLLPPLPELPLLLAAVAVEVSADCPGEISEEWSLDSVIDFFGARCSVAVCVEAQDSAGPRRDRR